MEPFQDKLPIIAKATLPTKAAFAMMNPPSPCHVFERLAIASHPNTRHAEDSIAEMESWCEITN